MSKARTLTKSVVASADTATIGILASLAVAVLLAVASGYLLLRAITRPLERLVSVVEVMRKGYILNDKLVQPALVKVAVRKSEAEKTRTSGGDGR